MMNETLDEKRDSMFEDYDDFEKLLMDFVNDGFEKVEEDVSEETTEDDEELLDDEPEENVDNDVDEDEDDTPTVTDGEIEQNDTHSVKVQNIAFILSLGMLGVPFYGWGWSAFFIGIIVLAAVWFGLNFKKEKQLFVTARAKNTILLCMLMLMVGYSTYAVIVIRQPTRRWTRTRQRISSPWATISDVSSMVSARCSTDRPTLRRWLSRATGSTAVL